MAKDRVTNHFPELHLKTKMKALLIICCLIIVWMWRRWGGICWLQTNQPESKPANDVSPQHGNERKSAQKGFSGLVSKRNFLKKCVVSSWAYLAYNPFAVGRKPSKQYCIEV